jgi:hypothetical protein
MRQRAGCHQRAEQHRCRRWAAAFLGTFLSAPAGIVLRRESGERCRWHFTARAATLLRT